MLGGIEEDRSNQWGWFCQPFQPLFPKEAWNEAPSPSASALTHFSWRELSVLSMIWVRCVYMFCSVWILTTSQPFRLVPQQQKRRFLPKLKENRTTDGLMTKPWWHPSEDFQGWFWAWVTFALCADFITYSLHAMLCVGYKIIKKILWLSKESADCL